MTDEKRKVVVDKTFGTPDEAKAALEKYLDGDGVIEVHAEDCAKSAEPPGRCTCTPLALQLGAKS